MPADVKSSFRSFLEAGSETDSSWISISRPSEARIATTIVCGQCAPSPANAKPSGLRTDRPNHGLSYTLPATVYGFASAGTTVVLPSTV